MALAALSAQSSEVEAIVHAQSPNASSPGSTWIYTYANQHSFYYAQATTALAGDGYIVAATNTDDLFLTKVNNDGINVWQKTIDYGEGGVSVKALVRLPNRNEYVLLATIDFNRQVGDQSNVDGAIIKFNDSGEIIWQRRYNVDPSKRDELNDMVVAQDGTLLVAGWTQPNSGNNDALLMKVAQDGTVLWTRTYDHTYDTPEVLPKHIPAHEGFNSLIETSDGAIVAVGYSGFVLPGDTALDRDVWVIKIDQSTLDSGGSDGIIWERRFATEPDVHPWPWDEAYDVVEMEDSNLVLAASTISRIGPCKGNIKTGYLIELRSDSGLVWQKEYGNNQIDECLSFTPTRIFVAGGNPIIIGDTSRSVISNGGTVMKIDRAGNVMHQRIFTPITQYYTPLAAPINILGAETDPNGQLLLAGSIGSQHLWFARTNADGILTSPCGRAPVNTDNLLDVRDINGIAPMYPSPSPVNPSHTVTQHEVTSTPIAYVSIKDATGTPHYLCNDIAGYVKDLSGNPVAGAKVIATDMNLVQAGQATTDLEGKFRIPSLLPGQYNVEASSEDYFFPRQLVTVPNENVQLINGVDAHTVVSGRILTQLDKPVFGIQFTINVNGKVTNTQTNENGEFRFENLPASTYKFTPQLPAPQPNPGITFEPPFVELILGTEVPPNLLFRAIDTVAPVVNIIYPEASSYITVGMTSIVAKASEPTGGSGIDYVDFRANYSGQSHELGVIDGVHDFTANINLPNDLRSQQILLAAYATDNAGNRSTFKPVFVNFSESNNNPNVVENWVKQENRAYINQWALRTKENCWRPGKCTGDYQCSVASVAMILAMNGLIGKDFQSMSDKAHELYTNNSVEGMVNPALTNAGMIATSHWSGMWDIIVEEVNVGRPVLMVSNVWTRSPETPIGHFFVIIGYREEGTDGKDRKLIVYDPFGKWNGQVAAGLTYDRNSLDANSYKGRWVYYDFNTLAAYSSIVTAVPAIGAQGTAQVSSLPSSPPDLISTEEPNWGDYPEGAVDAIDLITGTFQLSGLVTLEGGQPLAGTDITLASKYEPGNALYAAVTDNTGRYSISEVEPGYYYITVHRDGGGTSTREVTIASNTLLDIIDLEPDEEPSSEPSLYLPSLQR